MRKLSTGTALHALGTLADFEAFIATKLSLRPLKLWRGDKNQLKCFQNMNFAGKAACLSVFIST
jgi:hypothetical protein